MHGGGSGVWKLLLRRQEGPRAPPEPGTGRVPSARSPWGSGLANTATSARDTNSRLWVGTVRGRIWAIYSYHAGAGCQGSPQGTGHPRQVGVGAALADSAVQAAVTLLVTEGHEDECCLSGRPLFPISVQVLCPFFRYLKPPGAHVHFLYFCEYSLEFCIFGSPLFRN